MKNDMKSLSKTYKTFILRVGQKMDRYIRMRAYQLQDGGYEYQPTTTKKISQASRFIILENAKAKAKAIKDACGFEEIQVVDETNGRSYVIR